MSWYNNIAMLKIGPQQQIRYTTVLLSGLVVWLLIKMLWLLLVPTEQILQPATISTSSTANAYSPQPELSSAHLFGVYEEKQLVSHYRNAPETSLNLVLRGIVSGATDQDGFAIIGDSRGREAVYRVGKELPGGGEVRGIFFDRVVLFRAGGYETLRLPLDETDAAADDNPDFSIASTETTTTTTPSAPPLSASSVTSVRNKYALNIPQMASSYGLVKMPSGGYRISLGRNARQLVDLGLRNGDIIVSANGIELGDDDEQAVENLVAKILLGEQLSLEVIRGGRRQILQADINSVLNSN